MGHRSANKDVASAVGCLDLTLVGVHRCRSWAVVGVPVRFDLGPSAGEQLVLGVGFDLLDGYVGGVLVDAGFLASLGAKRRRVGAWARHRRSCWGAGWVMM
jgi:hypothetical protein